MQAVWLGLRTHQSAGAGHIDECQFCVGERGVKTDIFDWYSPKSTNVHKK